MGHWVVDSMGHWVSNKTMVSNWVSNKTMMSNWVSNKTMMSNWVSNKTMVSNWVSNKTMVSSMAAMGHNSTMSMADHMGRHIRGGGSGSKAKKSGNNESLHFC